MIDVPHRTPLQNWSWHRYMFKGFLSRTIAMIEHLSYSMDLTAMEEQDLTSVHHILTSTLRAWPRSQKETRKRREDTNATTNPTRTTDSS